MSYTPTTWVEKVTKVGPTNLNKLELGVQAAAATADAANTLAAAALPTPAGTNGQFLKRVSGLWVPATLLASDLPSYPSDSTKVLKGDGTWGGIAEAQVTFTDITTGDVSTSKHGFTPKAPSDATKFLRGDATWAVPAAAAISTTAAALTADVALTSTNTFYDSLSLSLVAGTWFLIAAITVYTGSSAAAAVTSKLWDGTTVVTSGETGVGTSGFFSQALAKIVAPGSTTIYKISHACTGVNGLIKATPNDNTTGCNNATTLIAIRLA